jgi:hypothetical protein
MKCRVGVASLIIIISFLSCKKTIKEDINQRIFEDILLANMISAVDASSQTSIANFSFNRGDSITISDSELELYFYGKDSLNGTYRKIDSTFYLVFLYKVNRNRLVFGVYDSKNKFVDKGLMFESDIQRMLFEDVEHEKIDFFDSFLITKEEEYRKIQNKYSVSRKFIDSLVAIRMMPFNKIKSPMRSDTLP